MSLLARISHFSCLARQCVPVLGHIQSLVLSPMSIVTAGCRFSSGTSTTLSPFFSKLGSPLLANIYQKGIGLQAMGGQQPVRYYKGMYKPNAYQRLRKGGYKRRTKNKRGLIVLWRRLIRGRSTLHT